MNKDLHAKSGFSILTLIGALGLMALSGGAQAVGIAGPPVCPSEPKFDGQMHVITSSVTNNAGVYTYDYRVCNLSSGEASQRLVDFELPWFTSYGDSVGSGKPILEILAPNLWAWEVETEGDRDDNSGWGGDIVWNNDGDQQKKHFDALFGGAANNPFNAHTQVLHFYTGTIEAWPEGGPIEPGDQLDGFRIVSTFGPSPVGAPDQSSWAFIPPRTGDPDLPLGPNLSSPEIQQAYQSLSAPEPATLALLVSGLAALLALRKRRGSPG